MTIDALDHARAVVEIVPSGEITPVEDVLVTSKTYMIKVIWAAMDHAYRAGVNRQKLESPGVFIRRIKSDIPSLF